MARSKLPLMKQLDYLFRHSVDVMSPGGWFGFNFYHPLQ